MEHKAFDHFFFPFNEAFFEDTNKVIQDPASEFADVGSAFKRNIVAVISTSSLPFQLVLEGIQRRKFMQILSAERILSLIPEEGDKKTPEQKEQEALERAREKFMHEGQIDPVSVLDELAERIDDIEQCETFAELLRQNTVNTWSAIEVLSQDVFCRYVSMFPKVALDLLRHPNTKQVLRMNKIPIEDIARWDFNLSATMGEFLLSDVSFSNLATIKNMCLVLFHNEQPLHDSLSKKELWVLNQRRHLIVHRRGVVDERYLKATNDILDIGSKLVIHPRDLRAYLKITLLAGVRLLESAQKTCVKRKST